MKSLPAGIIYDLDGTLVDSLPGIESALARAVKKVLPGQHVPALRDKIGPPIQQIIAASFDSVSEADARSIADQYRVLYDSGDCLNCSLFPGVIDTLGFFAAMKIRQFVVTNKPLRPTRQMFARLCLKKFVEGYSCPDSHHPRFTSKASSTAWLLDTHGLQGRECVMVGDSPEDAESAAANEMRFIGVSYGYASHLLPNSCERICQINQLCELVGAGVAPDSNRV